MQIFTFALRSSILEYQTQNIHLNDNDTFLLLIAKSNHTPDQYTDKKITCDIGDE